MSAMIFEVQESSPTFATTLQTKGDNGFESVLLWQFCPQLNHSFTYCSLGNCNSGNTANCNKGFLYISNFSKSLKKLT